MKLLLSMSEMTVRLTRIDGPPNPHRCSVESDAWGMGKAMMLMSTLCHTRDKFSQAFPV